MAASTASSLLSAPADHSRSFSRRLCSAASFAASSADGGAGAAAAVDGAVAEAAAGAATTGATTAALSGADGVGVTLGGAWGFEPPHPIVDEKEVVVVVSGLQVPRCAKARQPCALPVYSSYLARRG